jgi:hypothetical protein
MNSKLKRALTEHPRPSTGRCKPLRGFGCPEFSATFYFTTIGLLDTAGLDEGLLSLSLSNLLYMESPYSYKKCQ